MPRPLDSFARVEWRDRDTKEVGWPGRRQLGECTGDTQLAPVEDSELTGPLACVYGVQGVVKNIIPAIPSTNAVVAAACALETLKMATMCSVGMNNYTMYGPVPPQSTQARELRESCGWITPTSRYQSLCWCGVRAAWRLMSRAGDPAGHVAPRIRRRALA